MREKGTSWTAHGGGAAPRRPWARALLGLAVALTASVVPAGGGPARAQAVNRTTTTTTTPPGGGTPPSGAVPPAPPPPAPPPPVPPEVDSVVEPAPTAPVAVPPPPPAPAPAVPAPEAQAATQAELARRRQLLDGAVRDRAEAAARFEKLAAETAALEARLAGLRADREHQEGRLLEARNRLKRLAVARYVATPVAPVSNTLEAPTFMDLSRRVAMLGAVVEADESRILEYQSAARQATAEVERVSEEVARSRGALAQAAGALQVADAGLVASQAQLVATHAASSLVLGGLSFPVAGPHTFTDTFGAPRMFGTPYAHLHQGTDVFAAQGTPVVAIERGLLVRVGTDVLGGTKLWLVGAGGTRYFYAHLSAFAPGVVEGKPVEAGEVVGFVGNTGNARGTPPHLHFEAHPAGGPAINPYPLLRLVDEAQRRLMPTPLPVGPGG